MGSTLLLFITILIEAMRALAHIGKHILHTRIRTYQYCFRHLNENVSSFYSKQNTRESKGRNNAIQWLDKIVYARVDTKCNVHMHELRKFNDAFATWIKQNEPEHWEMSKISKKKWDKMTTNLAESFTAWLKNERHHSICTFLMEHMISYGLCL